MADPLHVPCACGSRAQRCTLEFIEGLQVVISVMASPKRKKHKAGEPAPQGGGDIESAAPGTGGHRSTERKLGRREVIAIIGGLALAMFLGALNQTIVATALPTIGRAFDDFENLSWVVIAYLLTSTVVAPLYGKLSDIYGRRGMMLVALGVFMAGSAACAAAPSMLMLILGRGLQGIGGGGIVPLTPVDHRRRGAAARARLLPGLYRLGLDRRRRRRPGARRRHCRASALVGDFLAQRAARLGGGAVVQPATQTRAGPRTRPQDRSHRRRADDGRCRRAAAGADLGRHALFVAVAADRHSGHRGGSC